jgi:hypothetical protein
MEMTDIKYMRHMARFGSHLVKIGSIKLKIGSSTLKLGRKSREVGEVGGRQERQETGKRGRMPAVPVSTEKLGISSENPELAASDAASGGHAPNTPLPQRNCVRELHADITCGLHKKRLHVLGMMKQDCEC